MIEAKTAKEISQRVIHNNNLYDAKEKLKIINDKITEATKIGQRHVRVNMSCREGVVQIVENELLAGGYTIYKSAGRWFWEINW